MRTCLILGLSAILGLFGASCATAPDAKSKDDGKELSKRAGAGNGDESPESASDAEVGPPANESPSESPRARRQEKTLARDERDKDGNFLELLDQRQQQIEDLKKRITTLENEARDAREALSKVRESETVARGETERIQGMLQDALIREKSLQEQVLHARLDGVRLEKELYRAKIASLTGSDAK